MKQVYLKNYSVQAIKEYRKLTGAGLKECVESLKEAKEHPQKLIRGCFTESNLASYTELYIKHNDFSNKENIVLRAVRSALKKRDYNLAVDLLQILK